jgi:Zinc finger, C3HC4 type (RING finger)
MATADTSTDLSEPTEADEADDMTCPICMEPSSDLRYLPCVHRFCLTCLCGYYKCRNKTQLFSSRGIPCPLCRRWVRLASVEDVNHLPVNAENARLAGTQYDEINDVAGLSGRHSRWSELLTLVRLSLVCRFNC